MRDPIEERLQDLERLVLKQAERIDALEDALAVMHRTAARAFLTNLKKPESDAA
ncbi:MULTISPECIES: hypothetical protein [unclassified Caulobacter]|uniref:hypothetical protein n=1 Tax=unclassified Caulobacter TaxID=2648921 RepID=UPI000A5A5D31|nr:hypothetical protein [Caulobacter sp. UNC358MFTsu5.1]